MNKVILMGRLTGDPELKTTQNGTEVTSFSIAVDREYKADKQEVDFINIVAWRKTAEFICKYFRKGKPIIVIGKLQVRSYDDKNGQKRYVTEVVADSVNFTLSDNTGNASRSNDVSVEVEDSTSFVEVDDDGDLPF